MTQPGSPATGGSSSTNGRKAVHASRLTRRRRALLGVGIAAALLGIGGVIGASFVKSPQQLAADTAAPPRTLTTAPVVSQILTSSVQMRGVVYPATEYDVYPSTPASSAAAGAGTGSGSGTGMYISKLSVAAGGTITNGRRLAELDGEPLFALSGRVPAWRDLTPGESGPDVRELQRALAALGYYGGGDMPGYFGSSTGYAVSLYYEHLGYTPPSSGGVPAADVVFLPALPARVLAVNGATGQQPGQPFLQLAARGSLSLAGELPPAYASQVKAGLKVTVFDEVTGIHAAGTVSDVGTATTTVPAGAVVDIGSVPASPGSGSGATGAGSSGGSSGSSGSSGSGATVFLPVAVRPAKPLPAALNGENVLVTVETGRTAGPVLTVPVAAIVTTASGRSFVTVVGAHGKQTDVTVTPGMSENGYVQVTPVTHGALAAGDHVVVSG